MSNKFDLIEYGLAKEICSDLPKIRAILVKTVEQLTPYKKYRDAAAVINQAEDAIIMADLQLGVYQASLKNRGKIE